MAVQLASGIGSQMRGAIRRSIRDLPGHDARSNSTASSCGGYRERQHGEPAEAYNRREDLMRKARKLEVIRADLRRIRELTFEHQAFFIERWHEYFRHQR